MSDPYVVITADAHAGASIQDYREYLDEKHKKLFDDWRGSYKNPQRKHIGSKKHKNWDDTERLEDMRKEGVAGEVIFPNTVPPFFRTSVLICGNPRPEDYALRREGIRAHNRWLKDWCAEHPERRAGIGLIYLNDLDDAIEDVEWIAENGLRGGVLLPHVPPDCNDYIAPLFSEEYDRLWALIQDHDLVLNQHGGTGSPDYGRHLATMPIRLLEVPFFSTRSYPHLILSGVFERFPRLKYINTEAGCAWVPEMLERLDTIWERTKSGVAGEFQFAEGTATPEPPSFYAKRNCYYGASSAGPRELAGREEIGIDKILWGTDYPHYEGTYPHTRLALRNAFHDIPAGDTRAMLGGNAAELYGFDMEKLLAMSADYAPTVDEVATPLSESEIPRDVMSNAFRR